MIKIYKNRQSIRFRRWSRKAYAVFCSVGRCVTIGCLSKAVADSSLSKQKGENLSTVAESYQDKETIDEENDHLPDVSLLLLQLIQPQTILNKSCGVAESVDCAASAYFYSIRPNEYPAYSFGLFFVP